MTKIAIMGHGVVGSGVAEVIMQNHETISAKSGQDLEIKYILDLRDFDGLSYSDKFIKDFNIIANDEEISIVAEVMGGIEPAYTYVKTCLLNGKSVVTSNKELVAAKGAELLQIAREKGVNVYSLMDCYISDEGHKKQENVVVLGYAKLNEKEIEKGLNILEKVWNVIG